ncbi:MAG: hypothetical protein IJJ77_08180 [Paludibacteraceae bacterium]|nr:hypothetical protein [Paludibacteraceae bacterium]
MMKDGAIITKGEWQFARTMLRRGSVRANCYSPRSIMHQMPEMGRMMNDGAIIKGEWNDEGWINHHQGRIAIRPYDAAGLHP